MPFRARSVVAGWLLPPEVTRVVRVLRNRLRPGRKADSAYSDENHPERLAVLPFLRGQVLEVGCGHRKSAPLSIAVDLVPAGVLGRVGNPAGLASQADVAADGAHLPFRDSCFDVVVARHNLEHYVDTVGVLAEWKRVLKPEGCVVVVVPDEERFPGRTVTLDPTHYVSFTEGSLRRLFEGSSRLRV